MSLSEDSAVFFYRVRIFPMLIDASFGIREPYTDCISGDGAITAEMLRCA